MNIYIFIYDVHSVRAVTHNIIYFDDNGRVI